MNAYGIDLTPYVIFGSILFLLLLFLLLRKIKGSVENQKHWQHSFDGLEYSSAEFFDLVESAISSRNMPDIEFSRAVYSQDGILSDNREYLHIEIGPFVYDVGAAPFGNCFFVSLWFAERHGLWHKFKRSIPIFKESAERKSYYKIDTDGMINGAIIVGFEEAVSQMTTNKGVRALSESEKKFF